jgi:hypothetical protein
MVGTIEVSVPRDQTRDLAAWMYRYVSLGQGEEDEPNRAFLEVAPAAEST